MITKWISEKYDMGRELNSADTGWDPVPGPCENGSESLGFIKGGVFRDQLNSNKISEEGSAPYGVGHYYCYCQRRACSTRRG